MSIDIVAENQLAGTYTKAQMETPSYGDLGVAGFARKISYNVGETAQFCIDGTVSTIRIFRCGWYGGVGFREVATITNTNTTQPELTTITDSNGATTATAWTVTASWAIPTTAVSGMYMAMVRNAGDTNAFYINFVVRDDAATADIIYKTSDTTWGAAYNHYGTKAAVDGKNVYGSGSGVGNIMGRSLAVSYHRPLLTRGAVPQTFWWACELPLIRFLERNGYSVKYITSVDLDKNGVSMLSGKGSIFLSSGHDEYWTKPMRDAVETWRDSLGGHSIFMSGNEVFWKARFEYVGDEARMWCYKDTMPGPTGYTRNAGQAFDPVEWTGTWKDTRWVDRKPEWLVTGTDFGMNGITEYDILLPKNPYGGLKVWGGSSLVDTDITLTLAMGFESDHAHPTQPAGSYKMLAAYSRVASNNNLADANGQNYNVSGNINWGIVAQRYESGAVTVGFGTCQWSWTLDGTHDRGSNSPSTPAQQFTVNLLRDLGADPATLMTGITLQAVNSLDEYGLVPADGGEEPPEPSQGNNKLYLEDGTEVTAYILLGGQLLQVEAMT